MRTHIEGLEAVVRDLNREGATAKPKAERIVVKHAARAAERWQARIPVRTGVSVESIQSDAQAIDDGDGVYAEAFSDWFVVRMLENGTVFMAPRPAAEPAYDETVPEFLDDIAGICGL